MSEIINSKAYGEITVSDDQIIEFPEGILGFDYVNKFVFLEEDDSPFLWMQAYDKTDLAFVILRPLDFLKEYNLAVSKSDLKIVNAESADDIEVFAIVTIPQDDPSKMTANLQGPIIINKKTKTGCQAISQTDQYTTKHYILKEMQKKEGKEKV